MNARQFISCALITALPAFAVEPADDVDLMRAVAIVESNSRDTVIGDGGRAIGRLQIHEICAKDAGISWSEAWTEEGSAKIWRAWMNRYATGATREQAARRWNGGPRGCSKPATAAYWSKVKKHLKTEGNNGR